MANLFFLKFSKKKSAQTPITAFGDTNSYLDEFISSNDVRHQTTAAAEVATKPKTRISALAETLAQNWFAVALVTFIQKVFFKV